MDTTPRMALDAYLPIDRRRALARGEVLPERSLGSALFADLSGFTPLMEHLSNTLGPQQGAEELTHLLNALFTPLIAEVHGHGGSILAFGGDALTCWFPALTPHPPVPLHARGRGERGVGESGVRAAACAQAMLGHVAAFQGTGTLAGPMHLSMHIGIASGPVRRLCAGRPPYGLYDVLAGATVERMAAAASRSVAGQVAVDRATAAQLPQATWQLLDEDFALLGGAPLPEPAQTIGRLEEIPPLSSRQVRRWLAEPLYRRLQAGAGAFSAELRIVTSMFVQFAGLDYDGDPDAGTKLQRYIALVQKHLTPYEGYLAMVACGDKGSLLHIVFGAPLAHEDDPTRAVGFALELQAAVAALPFIHGQRIGVSVGRVYAGILGSPERCTYTVLGDEVNLSARLMQTAEPGQVLVSNHVQRAAPGFAYRPLGTVALKGRAEPVPVLEALAAQERRTVETGELLVGREEELARLAELVAAVESGRGKVLLLLGEAGVGKSALVRALLRRVAQRGWATYVSPCLSYGKNTPYLPWRGIVEQAAGLPAEAGPAERMARLGEVLSTLPDPPGFLGYWQARLPLLAEAMGLPVSETPLTRSLEGELRRDNTFRVLEALVRHLARERPAVVVLEDAYWADELSLALAAQIGRGLGDIPLLLTIVQRPFTAQTPPSLLDLQALPHQATMTLAGLGQTAAAELARQRLRGAELPPRLQALLQEKARGNPFFIEELLRALEEAGHLRRANGTVELAGTWEALELPDTIEGVVRARMDRLPEAERLTLKVAAVIGRTFQRPLLQEVHPARPPEVALARQLDYLGQAAFTLLEEKAPEWRYAFQHPILHEVAYETLLFAQRRQLHGAIGAVLEGWHAGDPLRVLDLLAYHYARSETREKAVYYLYRAAEKARHEYANEVALGYYTQALERLLPEEQEKRYEVLSGRERIYDLLGEREAQEKDLQEMAALAQVLADPCRQVEVLNRQARRAVDMGAFEEARDLAQRARQFAEESGDRAGSALAQRILGISHASQGEFEEALHFLTQARQIYKETGDGPGEASCLSNLGSVHFYRGDSEESRRYYQQALAMARRLADRRLEAFLLDNLGLTYRHQGDYGRARSCGEQAAAILREIGDIPNVQINLGNVGTLALVQGDLEMARSHYLEALQLARDLLDTEGEATTLCDLGRLYTCQGQYGEARRCLRTAGQLFRRMGHRRGQADTARNLGVLEYWAGRPRAAARSLRRALTLWQELGDAGNTLATQAWLGLACLALGEGEQACSLLQEVEARLQAGEYSGAYPEQELWWAAYRVWKYCNQEERARRAIEQAHRLVQEQAARIGDPALRRSFLEQIPVNREVELEVGSWMLEDGGPGPHGPPPSNL